MEHICVRNKYLRVHDQGADFAEVTEGLRMIGVFWETIIDSNVITPRSMWGLTATPHGDGSEVVMRLSREFRPTIKGRVGWALNHLAGTRMWGSYLRRALAEGEKRTS